MRTKTVPSWVVVGAEMVEETAGWGNFPSYGKSYKISAVLGNGNIRLDGREGQWRVHPDGCASRAGDGYSRKSMRVITDELRAQMELSKRYAAAKTILLYEAKRLEHAAIRGEVEDVIAEALRLKLEQPQ